MDLRIINGTECWNYEALKAYADKISGFEDDHRKNLPRMGMQIGQIGCHGCDGNRCTAELSRSVLRPGGSVRPFGEKLEDIEGFNEEQPKGWNEAEVIEFKRDAA
ncbi:hypothetical protein HZB74_04110 [Candidatus Saccharibacteria bacterium]|nr:hypothetical protein [Candidatus Saccharibacteria bacterium]